MRKKHLKKRLLSLGMAVMMLCSNSIYTLSVFAEEEEPPTPPPVVISDVSKTPDTQWTNQIVTISGQVKDGNIEDLDYIARYSTQESAYDGDTAEEAATESVTLALDSEKKFTFDALEEEGEKTYYIWAYDGEKEKSERQEIMVNIDQTNPVVETIESSANELTTNEAVTISGKVSDTGGAGIAKVCYSNDPSEFENDTFESTDQKEINQNEGNYTLTVDTEEGKDTLKKVYYVWTYDKAGNKSSSVQQIKVDIDKTKPVINKVEKNPNTEWTNQPVIIKVDALQIENGNADHKVTKIYYNSKDSKEDRTEVIDGTNGEYTFTVPAEDFRGKYYIWAENGIPNETDTPTSIDVKIDVTAPTITSYEYKTKNDSALSEVINFITGGIFFNKGVQIIITAADEKDGSGLKEITLYEDGEEKGTKAVDKNGQVKFKIDKIPFKKELSATAKDIAGNVSGAKKPSQVNDDIPGDILVLEEDEPLIQVTPSKAYFQDSKKTGWYRGDALFEVKVSDDGEDNSGLKSVEIFLNDIPLTNDTNGKEIQSNYKNVDTKTDTYTISTGQGKVTEDHTYTLHIKVVDNCNNESEYTTKVHQDIKRPSMVKAEFSPMGNQESKGQIVKTAKYGYFFKDNTQVTLTAKDNENGSGVKSITYYTVDYSKKKNGIQSQKVTRKVNENNQISFMIPANFKGKIHAQATDLVALSSAYVTPDAAVVESAAKHKQTSNITINAPYTSQKDGNGIGLYSQDVSVMLTIGDYYSGLAKVEWSVISPYDAQNNQSGIVTIENDGTLKGAKDEDTQGLKITQTDENLVNEVTKNLRIQNNSNQIKVKVKLTDRAGHTSEEELTLSIDKTAPTLDVSYDNNDYDQDFARETQYYKENRTATIVVTERNFKPDDFKLTLTNTDGNVPTLSNWVESKNQEDENKTTHTATLSYVQDGDYTFAMAYQDLAGNEAPKVEEQKFTIDKTVPTIQISYNNNQADSSNYYKEVRTATITIEEHNFETTRIKPTLSAKEGTPVPSISSWSTNGDTHTATITFQEDNLYTFDLEYADKAGNPAQKLPEETFYVDQTAPTLVVTGIKHLSANSGKDENKNDAKVGFVIETTDENFANATPHLRLVTLEGTKNCDDLLGEPQNIQNGQRYMVENLKVDGIYLLTTTVVDKAGNETKEARVTGADGTVIETEQISFAINRNGSVYTLDEETQKRNGSYSKEEMDITIQETNVNQLNQRKLTLFSDSNTRELEEGKDYKLDQTTGNGQWNQYTYTVFKQNFKEDGFYSLALYSVDEASNESENTMDTKNVEVRFAIDKTPPNVIVTDLNNKEAYEEASKQLTMVITDNMKLEEVTVYHTNYEGNKNDAAYSKPSTTWTTEEIQQMQEENVDFTYQIDGTTTQRHKVKIVAKDAAGSESVVEVADFYVTKNWWVNYRTNATKVVATAGVLVVLIGGVIGIMALRKKKKIV